MEREMLTAQTVFTKSIRTFAARSPGLVRLLSTVISAAKDANIQKLVNWCVNSFRVVHIN